MKWFGVMIGFFFCVNSLFGQSAAMSKKWYQLGDDGVAVVTYLKQGKSHVFVHVHENEVTSLAVGLKMLENHGGKLLTLEHTKGSDKLRNVTFSYQKRQYVFDPNRIFTNDLSVLMENIKPVKGKGEVPVEVREIVRGLADYIWEQIRGYELIIALHNNKNEPASCKRHWLFWNKCTPDSYSILSYAKAFGQSSDSNQSCEAIYINPSFNNSDFFIVTQQKDFSLLAGYGCSVVLQSNNPVEDGSLSVFAMKHKRRYINSEAKHGNFNEQESLLEVLMRANNND